MTFIIFVLILGAVVLVHEFGHFINAKIFKTYVYEFSIGMGKRLWYFKKKGGETEYSIRLFPIGGFVRLAGEEVDDDKKVKNDKKPYYLVENKPQIGKTTLYTLITNNGE